MIVNEDDDVSIFLGKTFLPTMGAHIDLKNEKVPLNVDKEEDQSVISNPLNGCLSKKSSHVNTTKENYIESSTQKVWKPSQIELGNRKE